MVPSIVRLPPQPWPIPTPQIPPHSLPATTNKKKNRKRRRRRHPAPPSRLIGCNFKNSEGGGGDRGKRLMSPDMQLDRDTGPLKRREPIMATAQSRIISDPCPVKECSSPTLPKNGPSVFVPPYSDTSKDDSDTGDMLDYDPMMPFAPPFRDRLKNDHDMSSMPDYDPSMSVPPYSDSPTDNCDTDNILAEKRKTADISIGGPKNRELLKDFPGHVAYAIWHGQERDVLTCHNHVHRLHSWSIESSQALDLISASKLAHLRNCMFDHLNMPLISAFVERWHPETNSFHLPFGEMIITLHDVWHILHIPVTGNPILSHPFYGVNTTEVAVILGMTPAQVLGELRSGNMKFRTIEQCLSGRIVSPDNVARGYLWWLLGATLFVNNSKNSLNAHSVHFLQDLQTVHQHAWGAAALAYLYRQLGVASRAGSYMISGCLTLLEAWIYEYFPEFRPSRREDWNIKMPHAAKWDTSATPKTSKEALFAYRRRLNQMTVDAVNWTPFGNSPHTVIPITLYSGIIHCRTITEPYMPDRVMRQFGFIQVCPAYPFRPYEVYRGPESYRYVCEHDDMSRLWMTWQDHVMRPDERGMLRARFAGETADDYLEWFINRTHTVVAIHDKDEDINPHEMSNFARLQFLGARLFQLHPLMRYDTDDVTISQCLDEVTFHLEDFMPRLPDVRRRIVRDLDASLSRH